MLKIVEERHAKTDSQQIPEEEEKDDALSTKSKDPIELEEGKEEDPDWED